MTEIPEEILMPKICCICRSEFMPTVAPSYAYAEDRHCCPKCIDTFKTKGPVVKKDKKSS
jgi:hypothetical protein